jgi:P4 family phage/plasmid primase-like protien
MGQTVPAGDRPGLHTGTIPMADDDDRHGREFDRVHAEACAEGDAPVGTMMTAAGFIGRLFSIVSEHPIYFASLANEKDAPGEPGEKHVITREVDAIRRFVRKWDRRGRAIYFCVATIRPNATQRAKATISEIVLLHVDVDFKDSDLAPAEIEARVKQLRLPPSIVVSSGHGLHLYWCLRESIAATPETIEQVEAVLKLLCDHVGGDRQCCEVARLMRLPGSHNSKFGEWRDVAVLADRENCRYGLDEIEEWVSETAPIIRRKDEPPAPDNPWLAVASQFGIKPPIDVEQRLAAMRYGGAGERSVHQTQLSVTAALLNRGHPLEGTVAAVLKATRAAAGEHGERWNWRREEQAVRRMCADWLAKHPRDAAEQATGTDGVISLDKERAERKPKARAKPAARHAAPIAIADGVIAIVRKSGGNLLLTGGDLHLYQDGIWRVAGGAEQQRLRCLIQQGCEALGEGAKLSVVNAAWKRLNEHPKLYRETVAWDRHGLVAVANGVLDLQTGGFSDWKSEYFLRRKLGVAYEPARSCPEFLDLVAVNFADRTADVRQGIVGLLQEFFGACLGVGLLNREHRRALLLTGPSRTGKTELANIIRLLVGEPVASPAVSEIGERFGTATFYGASAWIRDDAVNEGDRIDPERFKTIVTGEPIDIERKNCPPLRQVRLDIPVILTANSLPTSRDSSDAIFNRSLVVEMTNVFGEEAAVEARRQRGVPLGRSIGSWVFEREGPGILNWALAGLARLLARGQYEIPAQVQGAIQAFKDDSNPVAEWARTMLARSDITKIERGDLLCAFHGWQQEEMGEDARLKGGRWLIPKLRAACPWITSVTVMGNRHFGGIRLNDEGLKYWQRQSTEAAQRGHGSRGTASSTESVNRPWKAALDE